ncbi:MAG TPA: DPP IV N-terminal domain-containing protein, partial [Blastocatellia bacterium]|nr:DPP IV N-terminal domain-containing protein [Blastocatellia bacterium]
MLKRLLISLFFVLSLALTGYGQKRVPNVDDLLNVKTLGGAQISPDGKWVAYTVTETDWKQNGSLTHVWLANVQTGRLLQLTRGEKSAGNPQWSPNSEWLSFTSNRIGDKNQIFVIRPDGGEATQLTKTENGVGGYTWSRDGKSIAFTAGDIDSKAAKARQDYLGGFEVVRREYTHSHLWTFDVAEALKAPAAGTQRTKGKDFTVGGASWSPDGKWIAFSATVNPDLIQGGTSDIYLLSVADNSIKKLVSQPGPDSNPNWSPDGKWIVFSSAMGNPKFFHA